MSDSVSTFVFLAAIVALVMALVLWSRRIVRVIYPPNVGLLYRDGRFERELPPGRYSYFDPFRRTKVVMVSLAELPGQLGEVSVLSKDQFSFRLGLAPVLKIVDARLFVESQPDIQAWVGAQWGSLGTTHVALQPLTAAAAMEVAATKTLAEILAEQAAVQAAIEARLADAIPGARIERVLLTAVTLPPETRRMFTDVERAKFEAQASLERARGEQAALRVLANAARLVTDNPALANLRLLQAVESTKGQTTIIIGNAAAPLPGLGGQPSGAGKS